MRPITKHPTMFAAMSCSPAAGTPLMCPAQHNQSHLSTCLVAVRCAIAHAYVHPVPPGWASVWLALGMQYPRSAVQKTAQHAASTQKVMTQLRATCPCRQAAVPQGAHRQSWLDCGGVNGRPCLLCLLLSMRNQTGGAAHQGEASATCAGQRPLAPTVQCAVPASMPQLALQSLA